MSNGGTRLTSYSRESQSYKVAIAYSDVEWIFGSLQLSYAIGRATHSVVRLEVD